MTSCPVASKPLFASERDAEVAESFDCCARSMPKTFDGFLTDRDTREDFKVEFAEYLEPVLSLSELLVLGTRRLALAISAFSGRR